VKLYKIDEIKVDETAFLYKTDWHVMSAYDQDTENIEWHVWNCMNYIVLLSEDRVPNWNVPPKLVIDTDTWNEYELLSLYQELLAPAVQAGYTADAGLLTRIKKALRPRRYVARRRGFGGMP